MKIALYGCGAIGLDLAVHLIAAGHFVTLVARGATLDALRADGIRHTSQAGTRTHILPSQFNVVPSCDESETQDVVFLTVKADSLIEISSHIAPLLHADTTVVSATNGIPPWYSHLQANSIGKYLPNTEVRDSFLQRIPAGRIVGAVIERSVARIQRNEIVHTFGTGYRIGELNHDRTERLDSLREALEGSGLRATITDDIHRDIWLKLLGNVCVSPMSVIAERNIGGLLSDSVLKEEMLAITAEAEEVGIKLGVIAKNDFSIDQFMTFAAGHLAHHEPSMLQDFRSGRPLEIHRIVEVVIMLAELPGIGLPVPRIRSIHKRLLDKVQLSS